LDPNELKDLKADEWYEFTLHGDRLIRGRAPAISVFDETGVQRTFLAEEVEQIGVLEPAGSAQSSA
jgi:hypothetical protein